MSRVASGYLSCSTDVTQRKTLPQLLGTRLQRQRQRCPSEPQLKETVVQFMRHHQNLGDLLLEINGSMSKCLSHCGKVNPEHQIASSPGKGTFIASVLQEQALQMDLPVGFLAARASMEKIQQIMQQGTMPQRAVILDSGQRRMFACLLQSMQELLSSNILSRLQFIEEIWKAKELPTLEIVWRLHKESIVSLEELVSSNPDVSAVVCWLFNDLLCLGTEDADQHEDVQRQILLDLVIVLVRNAFQKVNIVESDPKVQHLTQICFTVLGKMIPYLLDTVWNEGEKEHSAEQKTTIFWLDMFDVTLFHGAISLDSLKQFFYHTLTQILTYNPVLEASDAIRRQGEWCFAKSKPLLVTLYRKLFVLFSAEELITHFQQVLESHEVNWQCVLSCVSTLLVCQPESQKYLKELLTKLLINAFENYELESMITAFLLARQAALEGPAVFVSYSEWFKNSFGSASSYHGSSKKSLIFLLKFLTDLVPFETAQYLKVHILYPPYVASKYRVMLLEYISLAKTRLSDFQVSIKELGLYEDLSTANAPLKPQCQAMQDVERAVLIFENSGKIPASVMEASIFRRPYYLTRFLPALLTPRLLPPAQDSRMVFIDSLRKADKIPENLYASYVQACEREKQCLLEDVSMSEELQGPMEPIGVLTTALEELNKVVTEPSDIGVVSAQIAVISGQLKTMIDTDDDCTAMDKPIQLETVVHELTPVESEVRDLLLKSFCQTFITATNFNPPQRQGEWASLFVKMLCGHRKLLSAVLTRVLHLTTHQGSSLADVHILGLAAFTIHLHILQLILLPMNSTGPVAESAGQEGLSFAEYLNQFLICRTGEFSTFCMRFCTAAVAYAISLSPLPSIDIIKLSVPSGFVQKLQYIIPRLIPEARQEQEVIKESMWHNLVDLHLNWRNAALSLFKQRPFKELTKVKEFQLTFHEWLMSELAVQPDKDLLVDLERQDYQHWACYQLYLPSPLSEGGCGGDLETACRIIMNALLDFHKRAKVRYCKESDCSELSSLNRSCYESITCRLQEMVFDLEKVWTKALDKSGHFLLDVFQDRMARLELSNLSKKLEHQIELQIFIRILLVLPPSLLFKTRKDRSRTTLECEAFFHFTNTELRNDCSKEFAIPFGVTLHFFRGLLNACVECEEPDCVVADILSVARTRCPLLLLSATFWWPRLEQVLITQWKRFTDETFPRELQRMVDNQCWANRLLSGKVECSPPDIPWVLGAFLYFTVKRKTGLAILQTTMQKICAENELVSVLCFSLMDLISSLLKPKESSALTVALKICADVILVLEEQNKSWLNIFLVANKDRGPHQILYNIISDMEIKILPVAFYSLIPGLDPKLLSSIIKHSDFLSVAIILYTGMVKLFLDGEDTMLASNQYDLQSSKQPDPLGLITRGHQFLLRAIPVCPAQTCLQSQLQAAWKDIDPELKAALGHHLNICNGDDLYSEPTIL
ncbi:Fanconi anemia group A protein-like isoform X1 [Hemiscyllium ocellatum]|uniref:Fanconi anemia group A protein-like isoform X1 n=3 Tax=Hemiscyllium ocellatum TaxID=170820 RepID=UPI0029675C72|nr:Fanconi anemia group A protein-like isoform X1 [Hemiscyllium ocellatum]